MNYEEMQNTKDLLERCYMCIHPNESDVLLDIKKAIIKLKENMQEMDAYMNYIEQKVEESKYGLD
tara:strand:+ start:77 stop:271 length:195 start_codon:yes stop_codon:yes gene_type:complete